MHGRFRGSLSPLLVGLALLIGAAHASAAVDGGPDAKELQKVIDRGVAYLRAHQGTDGSFSPKVAGPGVTALVVAALLRDGVSPDDPMLTKAMAYLEKNIKPDGGIYDKKLTNYTTSVGLMAFVEANSGGKYDSVVQKARDYLKSLQDTDKGSIGFGGVGYDKAKPDKPSDQMTRPDLSNTQMFLEAMEAAGVSKDDPAVQNAVQFISRCQNLPGETNPLPFAKKTSPDDKGGLTYTPLDADDSPHKAPGGGLRSLGSMTYAGLKSFLYAGVSKDDARVKAAIEWVRGHYTLDENPGMGKSGLYYYYHTFGKAMSAWGEDQFADKTGTKHDWRGDLVEALKKRQQEDGSWVNKGDPYGEGDPNLATAFALLALHYAAPAKK